MATYVHIDVEFTDPHPDPLADLKDAVAITIHSLVDLNLMAIDNLNGGCGVGVLRVQRNQRTHSKWKACSAAITRIIRVASRRSALLTGIPANHRPQTGAQTAEEIIEGVEDAHIEARRIRLKEGITRAGIDDAAEVMEIR